MKTEAEKLEDKLYRDARDFVNEWLWDTEKFGDTRKCCSSIPEPFSH